MTANELQSLLAKNIKKTREALRLSQMDLAEKSGISTGHMSDIERSRRWMSADSFARIAEALRVEPYQLLLPEDRADKLSRFDLLAKLRRDLEGSLVKEIDNTFSGYFAEGRPEQKKNG